MPVTVRPRPTWEADSPTIWVKYTALPVRKTPSPNADRTDWVDNLRMSGVGPAIRSRTADRSLDIERTVSGPRGVRRGVFRRALALRGHHTRTAPGSWRPGWRGAGNRSPPAGALKSHRPLDGTRDMPAAAVGHQLVSAGSRLIAHRRRDRRPPADHPRTCQENHSCRG